MILDEIVARKRGELAILRQRRPFLRPHPRERLDGDVLGREGADPPEGVGIRHERPQPHQPVGADAQDAA